MVILITGSTDGIGKAAALELTKLNHKVILNGAILMAVSNSFKVSFRLTRTREKAGKIKISLTPILD